jgi:hypothetical protein
MWDRATKIDLSSLPVCGNFGIELIDDDFLDYDSDYRGLDESTR